MKKKKQNKKHNFLQYIFSNYFNRNIQIAQHPTYNTSPKILHSHKSKYLTNKSSDIYHNNPIVSLLIILPNKYHQSFSSKSIINNNIMKSNITETTELIMSIHRSFYYQIKYIKQYNSTNIYTTFQLRNSSKHNTYQYVIYYLNTNSFHPPLSQHQSSKHIQNKYPMTNLVF